MKTISLALLFASSTALAQPNDVKAKAKAASDEAQQLYEAKDYAKAAERFNFAYTLDPDPTYHFNAAQAYRQAGDCANAKLFYQKFKDESGKDMSAQDLAKINKYIAGEGCTDKPQNPTPPNPNPNPPNPNPPNPPNPNPPNPTPNTTTPPIEPNPNPAQPSDTPHKSNALAYGVGAAGLVGIAVGFGFMSAVLSKSSETKDKAAECSNATFYAANTFCSDNFDFTTKQQKSDSPLRKDGERLQTFETVSFIAGGALVAGGVVLYILNRGSSSNEHAVMITPTPGGAAATATFRF